MAGPRRRDGSTSCRPWARRWRPSADSGEFATDRADPLMPPVEDDAPAAERPVLDAGGEPDAAGGPARGVRDAEDPEPEPELEPEEERLTGPERPAAAVGAPVVARTSRPEPEPDPVPPPSGARGESPAARVERRGGGGGFLTLLLSVVAAGAVAYGVLWYFDREGAARDDEAVAVVREEAEQSVAALEARLDARLGGLEEGTAALGSRLDEADARVVEAPGGAETEALDARLDELGTRLGDLDARFAGIDAGSGDAASQLGGLEEQVAALAERVDALYAGLPEGGEVVAPNALTPLRNALSAQDERLAQLTQRLDSIDERLEASGDVGERVGALEGEVASLREDAAAGREALQGAIDTLRQDAADARSGLSDDLASLRQDAASDRDAIRGEIDALRQDAEDARSGLSDDLASLREDVTSGRDAIRGEVDTLRQDAQDARDGIAGDLASLREEASADREALRGEVEAIRQRVEERAAAIDAEVARARSEADTDAAQARAEASLARMQAAIEAGVPYQDSLTDVLGAIDGPVPATLLNAAEAGVPSLEELRRSFPPLARDALQEASSEGNRVEGFFRRQLGVRSLEAREGGGADAILSRAEDALGRGDVEATLAELEALPPEVRAPLEGWIARAEARVIVADAAQDLATRLDGG